MGALAPRIGARMLRTTGSADIGESILAHHERPDGTGYPDGGERRGSPARGGDPGRGGRLRGDDGRPALPRAPRSPGGVGRFRRGRAPVRQQVLDALLGVTGDASVAYVGRVESGCASAGPFDHARHRQFAPPASPTPG